jgi:hypothetical protein
MPTRNYKKGGRTTQHGEPDGSVVASEVAMHFCTACPVVRWPACSSGRGAAPQMARPGGARPAQSSRPYRSRALLRVCRPSGLPDDDMMAPPGQAFIAGLQQTTEPGRPSSPSNRPARPSTVSALPALLARAGEVADSVTHQQPCPCGVGVACQTSAPFHQTRGTNQPQPE